MKSYKYHIVKYVIIKEARHFFSNSHHPNIKNNSLKDLIFYQGSSHLVKIRGLDFSLNYSKGEWRNIWDTYKKLAKC